MCMAESLLNACDFHQSKCLPGRHWWPWRRELDHRTVEVETEATVYIVSARIGLKGTGAEYVSRHLGEGPVPEHVSLDLVAKAASRIERMAREHLRPRRESRRRAGRVA